MRYIVGSDSLIASSNPFKMSFSIEYDLELFLVEQNTDTCKFTLHVTFKPLTLCVPQYR